jgi:riboflavin kinase/FMN adenylyltransferase
LASNRADAAAGAGIVGKAAIIQPFTSLAFMLVTHGAQRAGHLLPERPPLAVTIGNFDGVHKGHQAMIARLRANAAMRGLRSCVLTFEPHPREYFARRAGGAAGREAPTRLSSLREKLELVEALGVDRVHIARFSQAFAALTPGVFVSRVLRDRLNARWVLVGEDFRFGAGRAGNVEDLKRLAAAVDCEVEVMPAVVENGVRVSSGAVRAALAAGQLRLASDLLGRAYSISGRVVHGDKVGRQLGFATANIQMKHNRPPLTGIFAVKVHGPAGLEGRLGVASLGVRPTVKSAGEVVLEVHLFDFNADIYGSHLRVDFLHKIRDEEKYANLELLRAQIARDCETARSLLTEHGNA